MQKIILLVIATLWIVPAFSLVYAQDTQTPAEICGAAVPVEDPGNRSFSGAENVLEAGVDYRAIFCTSAGPVYIDLLEELTPITVNNFIFLAQQGYYNNTTFHRVIADFMVQGGDPEGTGTGGPGYQFVDEFVGFLHFDRPGWLAMANSGPGTNGSQFFITTVPTPHLDGNHTIFGEVLEGQDTVGSIELRDPETATTPGTRLDTVVIITDPATVTTSSEALADATEEEISAAFAVLSEALPADLLEFDDATSGIFTTDETVAQLPDNLQVADRAYLESHNHAFRVGNSIVNVACDLDQIAFVSIGYTLDAFASREDAAAALNDEALTTLTLDMGYQPIEPGETGLTVYSQTGTLCDTEVISARAFWQRGRFVATLDVTVPNSPDLPPLDLLLSTFVGQQVYERALSDVLRREIR